ncbi:MAG: hypothetical protein ACRDZ2_11925 [Ilumatobacteraceae bacterium]
MTIGSVAAADHLRRLVAHEDAVVQPYISTIGETSVVAIAGKPQLAVGKRSRRGDWRVQTEFGGSVELTDLTDELRSFAGRAIAAVDPTPTYARVDVVRDEHGALRLLELELVEPELFFQLSSTLADDFAAHLAGSLDRQPCDPQQMRSALHVRRSLTSSRRLRRTACHRRRMIIARPDCRRRRQVFGAGLTSVRFGGPDRSPPG